MQIILNHAGTCQCCHPLDIAGGKQYHQCMNEARNILLVVGYNGAGFSGWQRLPGRGRTVQETLEQCLSGLLDEDINVIGAGRTDAGVHAEGQAANFRTKSSLALEELGARLKSVLPSDLTCSAIREAVPNFHARYRALGKTYAYRLHDGPVADPHPGKKAWHVSSPLDEKAMQQAAELFTGIRNFYAFTGVKTDNRNFLRELTEVRLERKNHLLDIFFSADGFLNRQVRIMAALMAEIGVGRAKPDLVRQLLETPDRTRTPGPLAAYGLRLVELRYRDEDFIGPMLAL